MYKSVRYYYILISILCGTAFIYGQQIKVPLDIMISTNHTVQIKGNSVPYIATTGFQPVWNDQGHPVTSLFHTYYKRSDVKIDENTLLISFQRDLGSASVWMHIAYTGSRILKIDEGFPIQSHGIKNNPNSVLDVDDIVLVNLVNTGHSRMLPDKEGKIPEKKARFALYPNGSLI